MGFPLCSPLSPSNTPSTTHGLLFDTQRDADEGNVGAVVEKG